MKIIAQCEGLYLLAHDPKADRRDLDADGEAYDADTGERAPVKLRTMLMQRGSWGPWDGEPVDGLPESQSPHRPADVMAH